MDIFNERGCFGGAKQPSTTPAPAPDPSPTPTPTEIAPISMDDRRKKLAQMRAGLASTMKTKPSLSNTEVPEGKSKLGQ